MPIELGRRLIAAGIAAPEDVEAALLLSVVRGVSFVRALVDRGAVDERALEEELGRRGGLALRHVLGLPELVARLPSNLCRRLGAVPTRFDTFTGTVDVAAADPLDPHIATELGFHLASPIRVIRAPISAIEEALRRLDLEEPTTLGEGRPRRSTPPFPTARRAPPRRRRRRMCPYPSSAASGCRWSTSRTRTPATRTPPRPCPFSGSACRASASRCRRSRR
ncbi:MAG: hypothetical protein WKG00_16920 [Polyangiaceae bacterium]